MKLAVLGLIGASCLSAAVQAQTISRIIANTGLTPDDFTIMSDAARSLYDVVSPQVGAEESWFNADTNSFGTVVLENMREGCAQIKHSVHPEGAQFPVEIQNRLCPTADGGWQLQP